MDEVGGDDAALLKHYLAARDAPCPHCQYNLRDLTGTVCPECGEPLALRVQSLEPRQAAPIAGLIALTAGAGLNGLLVIYWVATIYEKQRDRFWDEFITVNGIGFLVLAVAITVWLLAWRKIRRLATMKRWGLVVACAAITIADLIIFIKVIE
jgi:hypothetical protein